MRKAHQQLIDLTREKGVALTPEYVERYSSNLARLQSEPANVEAQRIVEHFKMIADGNPFFCMMAEDFNLDGWEYIGLEGRDFVTIETPTGTLRAWAVADEEDAWKEYRKQILREAKIQLETTKLESRHE